MAKVGPSYWPAAGSTFNPDDVPRSAEVKTIWAKTLGTELSDECASQIGGALRDYMAARGVLSEMANATAVHKIIKDVERHTTALLKLLSVTTSKRSGNKAASPAALAIARLEVRPSLRGFLNVLIDLKDASEKEATRRERFKRGPDKDFAFDLLIKRLDRIADKAGAKTVIFYKSEYDLDGEDDRAGYDSRYLDFLMALLKQPKNRGAFAKSVQRARKADIAEPSRGQVSSRSPETCP
jgi:hypothetical protein